MTREYRKVELGGAARLSQDGDVWTASLDELSLEVTGGTREEALTHLQEAVAEAAKTALPEQRQRILEFLMPHAKLGTQEEYMRAMGKDHPDHREDD